MSFTRRLKYSNAVMKRNIRQNVAPIATSIVTNARAESWCLLGFTALVVYIVSVALIGM